VTCRRSVLAVFVLCLCLFAVPASAFGADAASAAPKNEISRAEFFLKKFEDRLSRFRGQSFRLGYEDQEALNRIRALKEKYPGDPAVEALFRRGRAALMKSKGDFIDITPAMLAYRENEQKLKSIFGRLADEEWKRFAESVLSGPTTIAKPFPAPDREKISLDEILGRYVILDDFEYPANQFVDIGREFVFAGSGALGWYFVEISDRSWLGPYEALKRYRRLVNRDFPEGGKWTLLGRISGIELAIPQAEKTKTIAPRWGWVVEPVAIYIPGITFAVCDETSGTGGVFAGEERMEEIKGPLYTVRSIPADVTPERLVEILATAVKEKNFDLFLDCIAPERKRTPKELSLVRYHWDLHLERFATFYVHVTTDEATVETIKGFDSDNVLEDFFLDDAQKKKVREISGTRVERATVVTRAWDERGRQYGSPKPHVLVRRDGGRWNVYNFEQPF
jgi:cell fate (sporulation/competence/biofilm development) regulator YlbF (YheA/YmcA/DUF963 family)